MMHWQPMSEMKDEYRDGREILVMTRGCGLVLMKGGKDRAVWFNDLGYYGDDGSFTHFMLIEPPEGK